jgi:hypothetical protein
MCKNSRTELKAIILSTVQPPHPLQRESAPYLGSLWLNIGEQVSLANKATGKTAVLCFQSPDLVIREETAKVCELKH